PDGSRVSFALAWTKNDKGGASAAVVKDAGDDHDITNGALIVAHAKWVKTKIVRKKNQVKIIGGRGVGTVTKPGLAVAVGQPAINPVPRQMIKQAVYEITRAHEPPADAYLEVSISVPDGIALAEKTLNKRLGIVGGISILGTTGIVRPVSADAWTATITCSMDVAQAAGIKEIVLSTGRTSERCLESLLKPPEEALIMMGDYLDFSLQAVKKYPFTRIHMAAMWAKLLKGAMKISHTHVRHGMLEMDGVYRFLAEIGVDTTVVERLKGSNTARETLSRLVDMGARDAIESVCQRAKTHYEQLAGIPVTIYLVTGPGDLLHIQN
ncbi:MAG: cobalamin biosynthesis protein CbiD, partial [Desulfofustis sp.]|nr:cobalamin biosynthesis protein CbiD [Desulfofustis sp.]